MWTVVVWESLGAFPQSMNDPLLREPAKMTQHVVNVHWRVYIGHTDIWNCLHAMMSAVESRFVALRYACLPIASVA